MVNLKTNSKMSGQATHTFVFMPFTNVYWVYTYQVKINQNKQLS